MKTLYTALLMLVVLFGCKAVEISSYWSTADLAVDGSNKDWEGKTWIIKGVDGIVIGFMNDDKYLYLSFAVSDRVLQRQVALGGLTVWFDRAGGEDESFGIRYPIDPDISDPRSDRRRPALDQAFGKDSLPAFPEKFSDELEILGPAEEDRLRVRKGENGGIDAALSYSGGLLVYEMKIPLRGDVAGHDAIGAAPGSEVGVGIETARGGIPGGGAPMIDPEESGGHAGMRGGMGGMGPRARMEGRDEPVELWARVRLALPDTGHQPR